MLGEFDFPGCAGRARPLNQAPLRADAEYVLYWSQMNRRADANHALEFAVLAANDLGLPVLFYEGLTCTYPYASDRIHTFILEGVPDTAARLRERGIGYAFYLRRRRTDPGDVLYRLAARAALAVTDDYPVFVTARHNPSVASKLEIPLYAVDSSCVVPMSRFPRQEYAAYSLRPKLHKLLPRYLVAAPEVAVRRRWRGAAPEFHVPVAPAGIPELVAACEIDHTVGPSTVHRGGSRAASARLARFLRNNLARYAREAGKPSAHATSGLSPYLHFGQISAVEIALRARELARQDEISADEFLEQLIVRRELAFNFARHAQRTDSLDVLPEWARKTLAKHARDRRAPVYGREEFENARTHDELWNAAQKELLLRGTIHGYYRMYWGKKIIEWSPSHAEALATMIYLHDRYALDGRDPNTYANILWCFGLHDRPWGERPVFGMVRYMSLEGMRRKTDVEAYVREIGSLAAGAREPFDYNSEPE